MQIGVKRLLKWDGSGGPGQKEKCLDDGYVCALMLEFADVAVDCREVRSQNCVVALLNLCEWWTSCMMQPRKVKATPLGPPELVSSFCDIKWALWQRSFMECCMADGNGMISPTQNSNDLTNLPVKPSTRRHLALPSIVE